MGDLLDPHCLMISMIRKRNKSVILDICTETHFCSVTMEKQWQRGVGMFGSMPDSGL